MAVKKKHNTLKSDNTQHRERLGQLQVLVADRDSRTATLVQRILFSFGFRKMDITTNGESALALLRSRPYDIIITEWNMSPIDGVALVKAIRTAKDDARIPRDIPIIMLTARSDKESVVLARDAGITEFVAKPFSAKTISNRIIQIVDSPRNFVDSNFYIGPCRRRKGDLPPGVEERRGAREGKLLPANQSLQQQLGNLRAADILNEEVITLAQLELLKSEGEFIDWAYDDIMRLERAYDAMRITPSDKDAYRELVEVAYTIKSQAGMFGYGLGTDVAALLMNYLGTWRIFTPDNFLVLRKHIDTIHVIFKKKIKDNGQEIAREMLRSLQQLSEKMG